MPTITPISDEQAAELAAGMQVIDFKDLGSAMIHRGLHRHRGKIAVLMSALGPCFLIKGETRQFAA